MIVIAQENDTVDALCWRHLGRTASVVEKTYELNRNLSRHDVFLKAGIPVKLPTETKKHSPKQTVKLWG